MKKRLVMGTLTAALIAGSVPYEIYAQQEEVVIQSEEEGQEEPSEPEQPEPAPSEEPQPTMEPEPTQAPEPTVEPEPTQAPAPTETPEEPTATPVPEPTTAPTQTPAPTETPQPTVTPTPALVSVGLKVEPGDASVVILDAEGNPVSAEENGRYSLLQGQAYELYVRKEGYQEFYQKIDLHEHDTRLIHGAFYQTVDGINVPLVFNLFPICDIQECFDYFHSVFLEVYTLYVAFVCFHFDPAVVFQAAQNAVSPASAVISLEFFFHQLGRIFLSKIKFQLVYQHFSFHAKGELVFHNGKKAADTFPVHNSVWRG